VRSSTSTVVVVNPALFNSDGASVGSTVSLFSFDRETGRVGIGEGTY